MSDQTTLRNWDANTFWDQETACNECKSDDLREDHAGDCDCYCHLPTKVKFLESQLALAREGLEKIGNEVGSPTTSYQSEIEREELYKSRMKVFRFVNETLAKLSETK